ncbi:hypothetical protein PHISCL_08937 [Aspergillus sclerotialis]|uniref:Zn(2)-C6 fungal-type domain-containing protein n=1 Tax=Aspergillus sclerotialis TaxID=2070753 RepID=A0A3A2Z6I8_9EURO|nr:hypothetical protein PHISCL_08937 [Aspergillus sclerotialis]
MESARVKKRSSNACQRCRRQKIKCSGTQPCDTCSKRKQSCTFDNREQKILVTRGFLEDLQRKVALLERGDEEEVFTPRSHSIEHDVARLDGGEHIPPQADNQWDQNLENREDLTNPLSASPSTFMTASTGRTFYLGTSSTWSFSRKVLSMAHEHLYHSPLPTASLLFDGCAYDLGWDGARTTVYPEIPVAPTPDYSIYLINAVKFHAGQLFHLFDEAEFMENLHIFYDNPEQHIAANPLWYIHYLLILAFGKAFVVQKNYQHRPPGSGFFIKALQLLPDSTCLSRHPINAAEILCCIALYLQSLDNRNSAHNFIGQAMRIALAQGMHTDMPAAQLGEDVVERCRRIWWTIYILDRQMTSLMGLPQSIQDDQLYHGLPSFSGSPQKVIAVAMQIKMCQIIAEINSSEWSTHLFSSGLLIVLAVYGPDGRLNRKFLLRTKTALSSTTNLAHELQNSFDLQLDGSSVSGVSRLGAHLHLLYHQCMVLATRPLLICFLQIRFHSPESCVESLNSSANVRKLLQVCVDSAQHMLNILTCLHEQSLLDTFLPFDLDSTFVSAVILSIASFTDPSLVDDRTAWLQKTNIILDEMISRGNLIADFRKSELGQLTRMLSQVSPDRHFDIDNPPKLKPPGVNPTRPSSPFASNNYGVVDGVTALPMLDYGLTTAEIMAAAESIDTGDVDWIAHAVTENQIW